MSNLEAAAELLTAINFDRFAEIEARHAPDCVFRSFRGPDCYSSTAVEAWHREFLRDYQDCNYGETEFIEDGDTVAVRATIAAKGYDWRPFTQRVIEILRFDGEGLVAERRLYGMLRDVEFDKPTNAAMTLATEFPGGNAGETRKLVDGLFAALQSKDAEAAQEIFHEKAVLIDGVYGIAVGQENIAALFRSIPRPAFGIERVVACYVGQKEAAVEIAVDPARPRAAYWVRVAEGKVVVIEGYWMLREIGVQPDVDKIHERHRRQVILPT